MNIKLNLDKNFEKQFKKLSKKYGEDFLKINGFSNANLNFTDFIDSFVDKKSLSDVSINPNANDNAKDVTSLKFSMMEPHTKLLSYNKIFYDFKKMYGLKAAKKWLEYDWSGKTYLHDAPTASLMPYCWASDLDKMVENGLFFVGNIKASPAQHLTTFNDHTLEYVSWMSNRQSGALGLPSYLVYSYYFWKKDVKDHFFQKNPEYYRKQSFQKFIFDLNEHYLRVTQSAFTNVTIMDQSYLEELFGGRTFPDGTPIITEIDGIIEHQKVFLQVMSEIRAKTDYTFPVLTYSLLYQNGSFVNPEFARYCSDHNTEWYDGNFYNGADVASLSSCCRLLSDTKKLKGFINSIGGTSLNIGSVKVNTINLRRIALETKGNKKKYLPLLTDCVDVCIKTLDVVRHIIKRNIEKGLLPNYTHHLMELERQFSTIGITAMYETMDYYGLIETDKMGNKSYSKEAMEFAKEIFNLINTQKESYKFDYSFNVEAIPAERANIVLCDKDGMLYPKEARDYIYSNQWIPLKEKCTIQEKIRLGAELDKECGGGQISHINLQGPFANKEQAWKALNTIAKAGVIYFAFNVRISICEERHGFFGEVCPQCGKAPIDHYQRIVGYLVPESRYGKMRSQEVGERKRYDICELNLS